MLKAKRSLNTKPPALPSKLLAMALRDFEWIERDSRYSIDMDVWVDSCVVCFAGSIMARRFDVDWTCGPRDFDVPWTNAFLALNKFRAGQIANALELLGHDTDFCDLAITPYWRDSVRFKRDIRDLISFLRREGL